MKEKAKRLGTILFPVILFLYPLLKITQGIELTDTCYGLVNYRFFPHAGQEWTVATYLANVLGALLMRLPFGDSLVGMRFYTGLFVSAMALLAYFFLKGKMPSWIAFLGEFVAISLCWIPTTSLYNYLTFFLFLCGTVLLYRGLIWQNRKWMAFAGVCLGASVLTRLPNIVECALIIAVFYYGILKKKKMAEIWKDVAACVIGFVAAFLVGFLAISLQFRFDAYPKMLVGLAGYSGTDETYSSLSMITSVVSAYVEAFKWVLILGIAALLGTVLFFLLPGKFEKGKIVLYLCMLPVLLRFLWGRGMFNLQYAFYWSVFEWCMVLLYVAIGLCIWTLADPLVFRRDKLLSLMVLLVILITPIGSNNETYPNMNNLFLVAPVTFWMGYRLLLKLRRLPYSFACRAMLVCVAVVFLIQSTGFGVRAVFRDSIEGQKRDTRVVNCKKLSGAKTNRANAEQLQDVVDYYAEHAEELEENSRLLTFGDVPGFCWLFDLPSALSHDWPDMNTYPAETMRTDLEALSQAGEKPLVILCPGKVDTEDAQETQKWELLQEFLAQNAYEMKLDNGTYQIYE